jgi:hypothetical protein
VLSVSVTVGGITRKRNWIVGQIGKFLSIFSPSLKFIEFSGVVEVVGKNEFRDNRNFLPLKFLPSLIGSSSQYESHAQSKVNFY